MAVLDFPTSLRRFVTSGAVVATAFLGVTGCGDDGPNDPGGGVAGTYSVVQVNNDASAPFLVITQTSGGITFRVEIMSGSITLRSDNTYSSTITIRLQMTGQPDDTSVESESGTYTATANSITFDPSTQGEANFTATRSGNDITFTDTDDDGNTFTITLRK